jgi:hypothetical protein
MNLADREELAALAHGSVEDHGKLASHAAEVNHRHPLDPLDMLLRIGGRALAEAEDLLARARPRRLGAHREQQAPVLLNRDAEREAAVGGALDGPEGGHGPGSPPPKVSTRGRVGQIGASVLPRPLSLVV